VSRGGDGRGAQEARSGQKRKTEQRRRASWLSCQERANVTPRSRRSAPASVRHSPQCMLRPDDPALWGWEGRAPAGRSGLLRAPIRTQKQPKREIRLAGRHVRGTPARRLSPHPALHPPTQQPHQTRRAMHLPRVGFLLSNCALFDETLTLNKNPVLLSNTSPAPRPLPSSRAPSAPPPNRST